MTSTHTVDSLPLGASAPAASSREPRRHGPSRSGLLRIGLLWMAAWWGGLGLLLAPVLPGGWLAVAFAALLSAAPLVQFAVRGRGEYPDARYRLTQTAFVQEHALVQAQNRIQELEWQLENTQAQAQGQAQMDNQNPRNPHTSRVPVEHDKQKESAVRTHTEPVSDIPTQSTDGRPGLDMYV